MARPGAQAEDDHLREEMRQVESALLARASENAIEPSLERIAQVVAMMGDPHQAYPVVHVTGTNGKTSTARIIDALLTEHGLTTGRFTSPHLSDIRERITIGGELISPERFIAAYDEVLPYVQIADQHCVEGGGPRMTFFEVLAAMAFVAFSDAPVDVAIIEVGLGGTWDATNVADGQVAVIMPIGLDHQAYLGDTVSDIAGEKAGIIKAGATVVVGAQEPDALEIIIRRAEEANARLLLAERDFGVDHRDVAVGGQIAVLRGSLSTHEDVLVPLHGEYQAHNAAAAVAAVEAFFGRELDSDAVRLGVSSATSPGRLEVVRRSPTILVDAAHNPHGAQMLADAVRESFVFTTLIGVIAVLRDKDADGILQALEPVLDHVVVSRTTSPRAMPAHELAERAVAIFGPERVSMHALLPDAIEAAVTLAEQDDMGGGVLATGSVVTAAQVRQLLGVSQR